MKYCVQVTVLWISLFGRFDVSFLIIETLLMRAAHYSPRMLVHASTSAFTEETLQVANYTPPNGSFQPGSYTSGGIRG